MSSLFLDSLSQFEVDNLQSFILYAYGSYFYYNQIIRLIHSGFFSTPSTDIF